MVPAPAHKTPEGRFAGIAIAFGLCLASALFYASAIVDLPITSKGEARESIVVQAMVRDSDYVLPMRNGDEIPSKPPLFHWLGAAASLALGAVTPASVRAVSVAAALVLLALTTLYAHRAWGSRAAVATGVALLSMQQVMASATTARVDMLLAACVAAATFSAARAIACGTTVPFACFAAVSLAVLAKGPVGYVLPALTLVCYCLAARKRPSLAQLDLRIALPVLALPLLWYLAAWADGGQAFLDTLLLKENFYRIVDPDAVSAGHVRPFWYYPPALLGAAAPWSLLLIPALGGAWTRRGHLEDDGILLALVWLATTVALFSLAGSKRAVYLLPCFPAVALLVGHWVAARGGATRESAPLATAAVWAAALVAGVFGLAVALIVAQSMGVATFSWIEPIVSSDADRANLAALAVVATGHRVRLVAWGAVALGLTALSIALVRARRWWPLFLAIAAIVVVTVAVAGLPMYRAMAQRQSVEGFIAGVRARVPADEPLHFYDGFDYAVTFYMQRPVPTAADVDSFAGRNRAWFFVWESSSDDLRERVAALELPAKRLRCEVADRFDYHGNPRHEALELIVVERLGASGRGTKRLRRRQR